MDDPRILQALGEIFDSVFLRPIALEPQLGPDQVADWDSVAHLGLLIAIEARFRFRFATGEATNARTVGALVDLIARHTSRSGS